jgi:predicted Zn finger-like uncharacterized protein
MSTVRLRRLGADYANLKDYVRRHPRIRLIQAQGDPPERYQLEYRIRSLRSVNGELQHVDSHLVEVILPLNYPRIPPQCRMLTPVFHPNIAPHAICVGDHWSAGESLQSIVARIGEMLAYQSYNVKSPLNGEAARWVEENEDRVPLDTVSLLVEEDAISGGEKTTHRDETTGRAAGRPAAAPATRPLTTPSISGPPAAPAASIAPKADATQTAPPKKINCPNCAASYRFSATLVGKKVRCQKCQHVFECRPC